MPQPKKVKNIVIHCSAGFGNRAAIEKFWKEQLGWKSPGYHRLIETDGTIHKLADFSSVTNGVFGYNNETLHICYVGGVEKKDGKFIAKDTRTNKQKVSIEACIQEAINWLLENDHEKSLGIVGHRDFSQDKNGTGIIESWERIKECPSFDAINEYKMYASPNRYGKLPTKK